MVNDDMGGLIAEGFGGEIVQPKSGPEVVDMTTPSTENKQEASTQEVSNEKPQEEIQEVKQETSVENKESVDIDSGKMSSVTSDGTVLPKGASTKVAKEFADKTNFLDEYLLGGLFSGLRKPVYEDYKKVDLDDLSQYKLLPSQQNKLNAALKETLGLDPDPTSTTKEGLQSYLDFKKKGDTQSRKGRVLDSALEYQNYSLTSPKIYRDLREQTDYAVERGLQAELRRQAMPDAQQARILAADTGAAQLRQALAAQQDAATRFAGLGMQRRFG